MAKPENACETHNSSQKQPYKAEFLSKSEINAAVQLIQLNSSADCYSDYHTDTDHHQEDDNNSFSLFSSGEVYSRKSSVDDAASSSSSSPAPVTAVLLTEAEKGEEIDGGGGGRKNFGERRKKRYRSIVELYRVTNEVALKSVVTKKKKKKIDASNSSRVTCEFCTDQSLAFNLSL